MRIRLCYIVNIDGVPAIQRDGSAHARSQPIRVKMIVKSILGPDLVPVFITQRAE